jgi:hypothetical protein
VKNVPGTIDTVMFTETIEHDSKCNPCALHIAKVGTIGSVNDAVLFGPQSRLAMLPTGKIVVAPTFSPKESAIADSLNALIRPFGRAGEGPGELISVSGPSVWAGDSVLLLESTQLTFLSTHTGTGRTAHLGRQLASREFAALPSQGRIVLNNAFAESSQFLVFDAAGELLSEMGLPGNLSAIRSDPYPRTSVIGKATASGLFWFGPSRYEHRFYLMGAAGDTLRRIEGTSKWFVPFDSVALYSSLRAGQSKAKPLPYLKSIRETSDGLLWAIYATGARDWSAKSGDGSSGQLGSHRSVSYERTGFDGVIEVFDPVNGQLVAATWVSLPVTGFLNDTLIYDRREDVDGAWKFDVYRFFLR